MPSKEYAEEFEENSYTPEAVLGKRITSYGSIEYFVKWKGLSTFYNSWLPAPLINHSDLIKDFEDHIKAFIQKSSEREQRPSGTVQKSLETEQRPSGTVQKTLEIKQRPRRTVNKSSEIKQTPSHTDQESSEEDQKSGSTTRKSSERERRPNRDSTVHKSLDKELKQNSTKNSKKSISKKKSCVKKRLKGIDSGVEPTKVIGITKHGDDLTLLVKWEDINLTEFVPASIVNERWPQMVIRYYEEKLTWHSTDANS